MKYLPLLLGLGLAIVSCTTSRVVPAENNRINAQTKLADLPQKPSYPVTIFLLERDIPPLIKRLGVVLISTTSHSVHVDRVVKQELQRRCQELGANGAYRLSEGYYPTNTRDIPYLVFRYE